MRHASIKTISTFLIFLTITTLILNSQLHGQQIHIRKAALNHTPSLFYKGISGSPIMTKNILSNLKSCGWFKLTSNKNSDYILKGNLSGSTLAIALYRGTGTNILTFQLNTKKANSNKIAQKSVDYILKQLFKVDKLCVSKIAFCAEIKKGIKEIYCADFDGKNVTKLTSNRTLSVSPKWEPGQKRLLYTMYSKMFTNIIEFDLPSRKSRRLIQFPGLNAGASPSPDGNYFAVILSKDGKVDLYLKSISTKWFKTTYQ